MLGLTDKLNFRATRGDYYENKSGFPWLATAWVLPFLPGVVLPWAAAIAYAILAVLIWAASKKGRVASKDGAADLWLALGPLAPLIAAATDGGLGFVTLLTLAWIGGVIVIRVFSLTDEIKSYASPSAALGPAQEVMTLLRQHVETRQPIQPGRLEWLADVMSTTIRAHCGDPRAHTVLDA
jgi:hypothetical protein